MKILVLAQDSDTTWMMVNALRPSCPDLQVMLEQPVSRSTLLKRRVARKGVVPVIGQVLFMVALPLLCGSAGVRRQRLIADAGMSTERPADIEVRECVSVNSDECKAWLAAEQPDVVVVNGTRIIAADVLGACNAIFLNTHCGITPTYRGVHGGYWAMYQGDIANMGVTVHVVNSGIDTGDIIYQQVIHAEPEDNFLTYPIKQYLAGIPLMQKAISDIANNCLRTSIRTDIASALWYHPTLWQYLWARLRRGVR